MDVPSVGGAQWAASISQSHGRFSNHHIIWQSKQWVLLSIATQQYQRRVPQATVSCDCAMPERKNNLFDQRCERQPCRLTPPRTVWPAKVRLTIPQKGLNPVRTQLFRKAKLCLLAILRALVVCLLGFGLGGVDGTPRPFTLYIVQCYRPAPYVHAPIVYRARPPTRQAQQSSL